MLKVSDTTQSGRRITGDSVDHQLAGLNQVLVSPSWQNLLAISEPWSIWLEYMKEPKPGLSMKVSARMTDGFLIYSLVREGVG